MRALLASLWLCQFFAFSASLFASDAEPVLAPSENTSESAYTIASQLPVHFAGGDNRRDQLITARLPDSTDPFARVFLDITLSCPQGRCDAWDRLGTFGIVGRDSDNKGVYFELMRFMTPFGLGESWSLDVSDFMPLLKEEQTFRVFIDTWVGPGHPAGNGWLVDARLRYEEGSSQSRAAAIVPLLSFNEIVYGDPTRGTQRSRKIPSLLGYKSAKFVTIITGHGQGNAQNCGEFCPKIHTMSLNGRNYNKVIWRDNCHTTVNPNQPGTWQYSRAGWCPGDKVYPWAQDISEALLAEDAVVSYDVERFENSCRPGVPDCHGCVFGTGCDYDGGLHTEPRFLVSSYIVYMK